MTCPASAKSSATRPLGWVLDNWQISGITSFISGAPFTPSFSYRGRTGHYRFRRRRPYQRRRAIANLPESERNFFRNFRTEAFQRPGLRDFGNAGVGILRGPGTNNWDINVNKRIPLVLGGALPAIPDGIVQCLEPYPVLRPVHHGPLRRAGPAGRRQLRRLQLGPSGTHHSVVVESCLLRALRRRSPVVSESSITLKPGLKCVPQVRRNTTLRDFAAVPHRQSMVGSNPQHARVAREKTVHLSAGKPRALRCPESTPADPWP